MSSRPSGPPPIPNKPDPPIDCVVAPSPADGPKRSNLDRIPDEPLTDEERELIQRIREQGTV